MCDYSLHAVASRPAKVGETLVSTSFRGTSTRGFAALGEPGVAVCLLPGTELAFEQEVKYGSFIRTKTAGFSVARFCALEPGAPHQHRDALAFPNGNTVLVTLLSEGQRAQVLQLPATGQGHHTAHQAEVALETQPEMAH